MRSIRLLASSNALRSSRELPERIAVRTVGQHRAASGDQRTRESNVLTSRTAGIDAFQQECLLEQETMIDINYRRKFFRVSSACARAREFPSMASGKRPRPTRPTAYFIS